MTVTLATMALIFGTAGECTQVIADQCTEANVADGTPNLSRGDPRGARRRSSR